MQRDEREQHVEEILVHLGARASGIETDEMR